jgi:hypothetical protein
VGSRIDPLPLDLWDCPDQVYRRVAVRVDQDEGDVLPVSGEPLQPVEEGVGLPRSGRPDEEGVEDHVLHADCTGCHNTKGSSAF